MPYLPQIKILVPSAQVSSYTTGVLSLSSARGAFVPAARGLFFGGYAGGASALNVIDYITVTTTGNATDFGDLVTATESNSSCASTTRGITAMGAAGTLIQYVTIATTGNASSFGNMTFKAYVGAAVNNSTRGVFAMGQRDEAPTGRSDVMEYITIATTGNSTDFGDLTAARAALAGVCSTTRGVFIGGLSSTTTIDYITTATTGNAISFGTLAAGLIYVAGASNSTRGIFGESQAMRYITIATTGNSDSFGNLTNAGYFYYAGLADPTRAVFGGMYNGGPTNVMEYFTIATTGNATDFGDLTVSRYSSSGTSSANGGL
jgi:hypothetical protein